MLQLEVYSKSPQFKSGVASKVGDDNLNLELIRMNNSSSEGSSLEDKEKLI